jgi:hypothetical protein
MSAESPSGCTTRVAPSRSASSSRRAVLHARGEQDGADPRQRRTAEQRGLIQRHAAAQRQRHLLGDDEALRQGARRRPAIERLAVEPHAGLAVQQRPTGDRVLQRHARRRPAAPAVRALATGRSPREHDLVAGREPFDTLADRLHHAGPFVAEHHRRRPLPLALDDVQVGAADADRGHADEHLAGPRLVELDLADLERPPLLPEDGRPRVHASSAAATSPQLVTVATFWRA